MIKIIVDKASELAWLMDIIEAGKVNFRVFTQKWESMGISVKQESEYLQSEKFTDDLIQNGLMFGDKIKKEESSGEIRYAIHKINTDNEFYSTAGDGWTSLTSLFDYTDTFETARDAREAIKRFPDSFQKVADVVPLKWDIHIMK